MFRLALPTSRAIACRTSKQAQIQQWRFLAATGQARRRFADRKTADQAVLPGSQSALAADDIPGPPILGSPITTITPAIPIASTIPIDNIPKTPPTPEEVKSIPPSSTTPVASPISPSTVPPVGPVRTAAAPPPVPSSPPPVPKKRKTFRRFLYLVAILGLSYAGGVYYALISDNFHDFFTEYIPFGEDAVLFFEERDYKRRFPDNTKHIASKMYPQVSGEKKVTISGRSGMSARIADEKTTDLSSKGPHVSALSTPQDRASKPASETPKDVPRSKESVTPATKPEPKVQKSTLPPTKAEPAVTISEPPLTPAPAPVTTTEIIPPPVPVQKITPIDPLNIEHATDPIVQEITKLLNDVIQVVNADGASEKYSSTMTKAKDSVKKLASDIKMYHAADSQAADEKIKQERTQFDSAAKELLSRVKEEQKEQELRWREEYEAERERLAQTYEEKLKAELEIAQKIAEQRTRNELLQQDIKLKESFTSSVRDRVETERSGRLSKINQLTSTVSELEGLASKWNEVVESNLKTQHLVVAVEAVRAVLDSADRPTPFLHELVALKEIASEDPVVNAAIASINPTAYQQGVPTSAQLVDRFRRVAAEVRKAALLPEDAGVASHAASFVLSKFMFKKNGLAVGEDVESVLTRTETLLEEGDLDNATREMNSLQGWAKVLSKDWLADCRGVLEVKQALEVIATEARLQSLAVE